ncbi:MAG: endonuclease/exonuclease/phosphatase family protein, partial [Candidatus Dormibacteria bacterium]
MGWTPSGPGPAPDPGVARPLRVATYNILLGGGGRWEEITELLRAIDADVVALQEAGNRQAVETVASLLGYQLCYGEAVTPRHQALLTRLPVEAFHNHRNPAIFLRNSLEVWVRPRPGSTVPQLAIHTVHLTAAFQRRARAEPERMRELAEVRRQV